MTQTKTKFLPVAGQLFIPGLENFYYLLSPRPTRRSDDWVSDDTNTFYVVSDPGGVPTHVIVKGPFLIDYRTAGTKIMVAEFSEQEDELDEDTQNYNKMMEEMIFQHARN